MSKLDELIAEFCPNGVEYKTIGNVCKISAGGDVPKEHYEKEFSNEYNIPIYSNGIGENALYGYTDIAKIKQPCVTIAARGTIGYCALRKEPFYPVVRLICAIPNELLIADFLKYVIETLTFQVPTSGIPQLTVPMISKYKIPIPPLPIQEEIVHILDNFTELTAELVAELTAELTARKQQYEYYRDDLLLFGDNVPRKTLGETCDIVTGGEAPENSIKGDCGDESHPYPIYANGKDVYGFTDTYKIDKDAVVISSIGANTGAVFFRKAYFTPIIRLKVVIPKENNINSRYLYYAVSTARFTSKSGSVPNLNANDIKKIIVPIPSLEEQDKIVNILNIFDSICADMYAGLLAEIEARKKQYEYYRDKLLTFKECEK